MTTTAELDERYGRTAGGRRSVWVIGSLLTILALAFGVWWTVSGNFSAPSPTTLGYVVVDDHSVKLQFSVSSPQSEGIVCALEARDDLHGTVGWKVVHLPPGTTGSMGFSEFIPTVAEATTGLVHSCWVD